MMNVGVIGCGAISKMHIDSFLKIPETRITAVSDINQASAERVAKELGADFYTDYHDLLTRKDIDLVSVCTPSGLHGEPVIAAAKAGKHVIVEKPLEITLDKIDAMISACEENHVQLHCIFNNRFREGNIFVKKAIEAGRFGKLINANASVRWYRNPDYYLKSPWHGTRALDGGGALMNQSIHYVDLLLWMAGGVEEVSAYTGTLLHKTIETEDTAVAALRFKNGALGTILATTSTYPGFPAELQIVGERGNASIQDGVIRDWSFIDSDPLDEEAKAYMSDAPIDNTRASDPMAFACEHHKRQIERAVRAILTGSEPDIGGLEARKSVELILGIYESSQKGRPVHF
ncbi:MAG: Gfo/Idh/MocA family oxidoreductase [Lachnospiraceae bacterium]|nr:Gfo/Idh/MocA family oxidoreductase [Lachnospiraceae bacterium]